MGLLDGMLGGGMQGNPFAQWQQMQANPFTRQIPGTEYLSGMGSMPGAGGMGNGMGGMGEDTGIQNTAPSDFAGVPPGLPNLPQDMQGFGFGSAAPQMNVNNSLRQDLIQQLLQQLMGQMGGQGSSMGGQGASMGGGMPGMPGMGGVSGGGF